MDQVEITVSGIPVEVVGVVQDAFHPDTYWIHVRGLTAATADDTRIRINPDRPMDKLKDGVEWIDVTS